MKKLSTYPAGAHGANLPFNSRRPALKVVLAIVVEVVAIRGGIDGQEIATRSLSVEHDHRQVAPFLKSPGIALTEN